MWLGSPPLRPDLGIFSTRLVQTCTGISARLVSASQTGMHMSFFVLIVCFIEQRACFVVLLTSSLKGALRSSFFLLVVIIGRILDSKTLVLGVCAASKGFGFLMKASLLSSLTIPAFCCGSRALDKSTVTQKKQHRDTQNFLSQNTLRTQ